MNRSLVSGLAVAAFILFITAAVTDIFDGLIARRLNQYGGVAVVTVPKRPPNIAIRSVDNQLLANRGDTGGAAVRLADALAPIDIARSEDVGQDARIAGVEAERRQVALALGIGLDARSRRQRLNLHVNPDLLQLLLDR